MWTKLDHLRKGLSILVFGALAVILLPVILLIGNDFVQILLICLLVAHFVIAVLYFYRGIAVAVMCALYVYLSGIAVAMQTVLTISNIVPVSAVSDLLNAAGVVFFLTFTMVIPVPRKARDFIRKRLQASVGKDDESNPDETMRLTDQRVKGTSYDTFITFRGGAQWDNLPYSWAMAEPRMRKLRIAVSIVLAVLCVVGLFVASVFESDTALIDDALPLGDWTFWVGLSSVISLIAAGFVMLAGIVRGLLAGIAAEAFLVGVLWGYDMLRRVRQTSQMMFIAVVALSVLLAGVGFWKLLMLITRKQRRHFLVFENDDGLYAADLFLKDACPIIGFTRCHRVEIQLPDNTPFKDLDRFNDNLQAFCANRKLIYAGAVICYETGLFTVYLYGPPDRYEKRIRTYFSKMVSFPTSITAQDDADWNTYTDVLAPGNEVLIKLQNQQLMTKLDSDFDYSVPHSIVMVAVFAEEERAQAFLEAIRQMDYEMSQLYDNKQYAWENGLDPKYSYYVHVQKTLMISEGWMNIETLRFDELVVKAGGDYEFISFGQLMDEEGIEDIALEAEEPDN